MVSKLSASEKRMYGAFGNGIFCFANFCVKKLKLVFGKTRPICVNQKFIKRSILEKGFEATLWSKMNVLSVLGWNSLLCCKFCSDEVATIFSVASNFVSDKRIMQSLQNIFEQQK